MASMNTRLNIEKLDENIVQKHGGSKQVGLKQLGSKQVGFKQLGHKQGAQGNREVEVFQVSNDDAAVAQRLLEDKQLEEKTNTDCLVKDREKVHLGIKVGANITVTGVPGQKGAYGGPRFEVPALDEDAEYRLCLSVSPKVDLKVNTRLNIEKLDENIVQKHGGSKQVGLKQLGSKQVGDREAKVYYVSNDDTAVAQRRLEDKQPEEKTNTDCLVKKQEKIHLGIKAGAIDKEGSSVETSSLLSSPSLSPCSPSCPPSIIDGMGVFT
ncbi:hypothetical protein Tco_1041119, partial [Tanacetum coccineum]